MVYGTGFKSRQHAQRGEKRKVKGYCLCASAQAQQTREVLVTYSSKPRPTCFSTALRQAKRIRLRTQFPLNLAALKHCHQPVGATILTILFLATPDYRENNGSFESSHAIPSASAQSVLSPPSPYFPHLTAPTPHSTPPSPAPPSESSHTQPAPPSKRPSSPSPRETTSPHPQPQSSIPRTRPACYCTSSPARALAPSAAGAGAAGTPGGWSSGGGSAGARGVEGVV